VNGLKSIEEATCNAPLLKLMCDPEHP